MRVLRDTKQAEEVAHDAFIDGWRNAGRFDPTCGSARTWAMTIAHRRAVERARNATAALKSNSAAIARTLTPTPS